MSHHHYILCHIIITYYVTSSLPVILERGIQVIGIQGSLTKRKLTYVTSSYTDVTSSQGSLTKRKLGEHQAHLVYRVCAHRRAVDRHWEKKEQKKEKRKTNVNVKHLKGNEHVWYIVFVYIVFVYIVFVPTVGPSIGTQKKEKEKKIVNAKNLESTEHVWYIVFVPTRGPSVGTARCVCGTIGTLISPLIASFNLKMSLIGSTGRSHTRALDQTQVITYYVTSSLHTMSHHHYIHINTQHTRALDQTQVGEVFRV